MLSFFCKRIFKETTESAPFDINNPDAHLSESVGNVKDAKADVRKANTNFCVITDKELIIVLPRCVDKKEHSIVGPLFEIALKIIKMISAAEQDNLYNSESFAVTSKGERAYQDLACIRFETSSPEKILETIKNNYKTLSTSITAGAPSKK